MSENIFDIILKDDSTGPNESKDSKSNNLRISQDELKKISTPSMFWRPNYLAQSAWVEHVPFAFWLIENLQPKTIVELGTHYGVSYFAFCQAVQRLGINTRCFAIDTWKGDEHSGLYGENVYQEVQQYNDSQYSDFSRLVRSTFDQALSHFENGSIDLLHIDGLHSLEAVTHDFESWTPKLSDNAVVIMHDTNVRERGFGVFKLFGNLKEKYPFFEFSHGHGLGILGVGKNQKRSLKKLYQAKDSEQAYRSICEIFGRLGRACADSRNLLQTEEKYKNLKTDLEKVKSQNEKNIVELSDKSKKLSEIILKESLILEKNSLEKGQLLDKIISFKEEREKLLSDLRTASEAVLTKENLLSELKAALAESHIEKINMINDKKIITLEVSSLKNNIADIEGKLAEEKRINEQHKNNYEKIRDEKIKLEQLLSVFNSEKIKIDNTLQKMQSLEDQLEKANLENSNLNFRLAKELEAGNALKQEKNFLEGTIKELNVIAGNAQASLKEKEHEIAHERQKINTLNEENVELNATNENIKNKLAEKENELSHEKRQTSMLSEKNAELKTAIEAIKNKLTEKESELSHERHAIHALNETITKLTETIDNIKIKLIERENSIAQGEKIIGELKEQNSNLLIENKNLSKKIDDRFMEIAKLTEITQTLYANRDEFIKDISIKENIIAEKNKLISEAQESLKRNERSMQNKDVEISNFQETIKKLNADIKQNNINYNHLQEASQLSDNHIKNLDAIIINLQETIKTLNSDIELHLNNIKNKDVEIANLQETIKLSDDHIRNLEAMIINLQETIKTLNSDIEQHYTDYQKIQEASRLSNAHIKNQDAILLSLENKTKELVNELEFQDEEYNKRIGQVQMEIEHLVNAHKEKDLMINKLKNEIYEIQSSTSWKITTPLRSAKGLINLKP